MFLLFEMNLKMYDFSDMEQHLCKLSWFFLFTWFLFFLKYFNIWLRKTNTLKPLVMLQMTVKWPANLFQGKSNSWAMVSAWFLTLDFLSSSGDTRSLICWFWDFRKWNLNKTYRKSTPFWINNIKNVQ